MNIRDVLERHKKGELSEAEAEKLLKLDFLESINSHTVFDHAREARRGIPEVVYGETKSPEVVAEIVSRVMADREVLLISRASKEHLKAVERIAGGMRVTYVEQARMVIVDKRKARKKRGKVGVLAAGSSDFGVAEEARVVAEAMGCEVFTAYDVGVAALHRVLEPVRKMVEEGVDALVVVAGMEGALPTVVSGLTDVPVIGVPTSVGYGYGARGEAALMGMLQSCSPGLAVVNIDNGVGAGAIAALISRRCHIDRGKGRD
jgi:pyridinium-3,5-biscarboxylic acid mononucleotide synthase